MNNLRLVIAGAVFYDNVNDKIVVPNRTGEFIASECNTYYKKNDYIKKYGKKAFEENKECFIEDEGSIYYWADDREIVSHCNLELVSDLSNLIFIE